MTFFATNFQPLIPLSPKLTKFCSTRLVFCLKHCFHHQRCTGATHYFYTTWVQAVACQKQLQNQNWQGAVLGEHPKNFGTPYLFL